MATRNQEGHRSEHWLFLYIIIYDLLLYMIAYTIHFYQRSKLQCSGPANPPTLTITLTIFAKQLQRVASLMQQDAFWKWST